MKAIALEVGSVLLMTVSNKQHCCIIPHRYFENRSTSDASQLKGHLSARDGRAIRGFRQIAAEHFQNQPKQTVRDKNKSHCRRPRRRIDGNRPTEFGRSCVSH